MTRSLFIATTFLLFSTGLCRAEEERGRPPEFPDEIFNLTEATHNERLALRFRLGGFNGYFEKTPLGVIEKKAQNGTIAHEGDAHDSQYWLCYTVFDAAVPQRVWIVSNGEMGGPERTVTDMVIEAAAIEAKGADCPSLPKTLQPVAVDRGIAPGLTRQAIIAKLGEPSYAEGEWMAYLHASKVSKQYDEAGWVLVRLQNDRAERIHAGKLTAN